MAHINSLKADAVIATLERGLAAWEALSPEERRLPANASLLPEHRWEDSYPKAGLVLERFARDLKEDETCDVDSGGRWNVDYAWFTADEVRDFLPAELRVGSKHELPELFTQRLARFHLVDNARGQTLPFAPEEVLAATLEADVVAHDGDRVELRLHGSTRARAEGPWLLGDNLWKPRAEHPRGVMTKLLGNALWDASERRFLELELVALGRHWGRGPANGRGRDASPGPIGFHLQIPPDERPLAPTFIAVYDAAWVKAPAADSDTLKPLGARRKR